MTTSKWSGLASFLTAICFFVAPVIYLTGNLRDAIGIFAYDLADFFYGPVLSISLITVTYFLREKIGDQAKRRMDFALLFAVLAAVGLAGVAFMRASNRHYHLLHPELNLENDVTVLLIWQTLVSGFNGFAFHFLGWNFILLGSVGWTTNLFPRGLNVLYFLTGIISMFSYLFRDGGNLVVLPVVAISIWQGILLWKDKKAE